MSTPLLTVNLSLDESAVQSDGGSNFWYKRVTTAGADLSTPDTWRVGAGKLSTNFEYGQVNEQLHDEGNQPFGTKRQPKVSNLVFKLAQDDVNTEKFITRGVLGQYFAIVADCGEARRVQTAPGTGSGYRKLRYFGIVKFDPMYKVNAPDGRQPELVGKVQVNYAALTLGASPTVPSVITDLVAKASLDATAAAAIAFSIAVGDCYDVVECAMSS